MWSWPSALLWSSVSYSTVQRFGARLRVTVREVRATAEYAKVVDYLRGLSLVEEVMVDRVTPDEVTISMSVRGSRIDLERTIALGDMLVSVPVQAVSGADAANADLIYALLR